MPVFSDVSLLFIHIPKNAGKSVEDYFLGVKPDNEGLRGGRSRLNSLAKYLLNLTANPLPKQMLLGSYDYAFAAQHLTLGEIKHLGLIGAKRLRELTTFCVVRNPYDRAVSTLVHHYASDPEAQKRVTSSPKNFERSLAEWLDSEPVDHNQIAHKRTQFEFLTLDGSTVAVENILRYESLGKDFDAFISSQGLPAKGLGWRGKQRKSRDYREHYTEAAREMVEQYFEKDFEMLGYELGL